MKENNLIVEVILPGADSVKVVRNMDSFKTLTCALAAYMVRRGYDATVAYMEDAVEDIKAGIKADIATSAGLIVTSSKTTEYRAADEDLQEGGK